MSVEKAYKSSKSFYDGIITQSSLLGKVYMKLLWQGTDDNVVAKYLLDNIADDFKGALLDVPVGTAVFTHNKWRSLINSKITCIDYSEDMLEQAKVRLGHCKHIECIQGDVGNIQFDDECFDVVVSMNGFHAFPDQMKAYKEIHRVLKKDGLFLASFYIQGQSKLTDWWVNVFLSKKGWFTKPFQSLEDVKSYLNTHYNDVEIAIDGSIVYFKCTK